MLCSPPPVGYVSRGVLAMNDVDNDGARRHSRYAAPHGDGAGAGGSTLSSDLRPVVEVVDPETCRGVYQVRNTINDDASLEGLYQDTSRWCATMVSQVCVVVENNGYS